MYKYNPDDCKYVDIAEQMRKVYALYEKKDETLPWAIEDLYYLLKNLRTYKLMPAEKVIEMQEYFRSLLYD